jgi:phytol kinase
LLAYVGYNIPYMLLPILACITVFCILLASELLWRSNKIKDESARKFVHMSVGAFVAFWPFFMSWQSIQFISLAFLSIILVSYRLNVFHAIHNVKRKTMGEIWFAVVIGLVATFIQSKWIFWAAIMHMALADGFAAIIGTALGRKSRYKVFGQTKSLAGSSMFWIVSIGLLALIVAVSPSEFSHSSKIILTLLPITATLLENVSPKGADNVIVPIFIALALSSLSVLR